MAGEKNIFDILQEYEEQYERPLPIKYDLLYFSDQHRKFDALLRRYWNFLHPLTRDLFTSFANEFQYIITLLEENQTKLKEKDEEVAELRNSVAQKLEEFEQTFESRVIEGVANVKNRNFDEIYEENLELKEKIISLNEDIKDKEDLITNLRNEINLLIDDSDKQIETTKKLEDNVYDSIANFDQLAKQLDSFELELTEAQKAKEQAGEQIDTLVTELEEKDLQIQSLKETYEMKLRESEERFHQLKEKVREISPNIEKIHAQSRKVQQDNTHLIHELEVLKAENQALREVADKSKEQDFNKLTREKSNLETENKKLREDIDTLKVRNVHQRSLLDEYKGLSETNKSRKIEKHTNQPAPKPNITVIPRGNSTQSLQKPNHPTAQEEDTELVDEIKMATDLPTVPTSSVDAGESKLEKFLDEDNSDIKLAIKNSLAQMRKEHEGKVKNSKSDPSETLLA